MAREAFLRFVSILETEALGNAGSAIIQKGSVRARMGVEVRPGDVLILSYRARG
ncbi:MAG TPA: hypothetical protein VGO53_14660 [Steroidobacteraceae bacterium]|nr:hypothetical protein [Steroidobacteraceae bacterium]